MTIDEQISRAKTLIAKREEIDRELNDLFGGAPIVRKALHCAVCGETGHNAKTCPTKQLAEATDPLAGGH
jgi:hypothetical protein